MSIQIGVIVGSLRKESYNLKIAQAISKMASSDIEFKFVKIDDLPFFNEDIDSEVPPASYDRLRQDIKDSDAFLFVMPEYNRGMPAVIKNALDVGSRPYGKNSWAGKPAAVVTASQGNIGGFASNQQIRESFVFLDIHPLQQPEMYLSQIQNSFDEQGNLNEKTKMFLKSFMVEFESWIHKISKK